MRIYQSSDGKWIFFDGTSKHFFDTEQEAINAMGKVKMVNEVLSVIKMLVEPMEKVGGCTSAVLGFGWKRNRRRSHINRAYNG